MNLTLTRQDLVALLAVLEVADWVLHAYQTDEPTETLPFRVLTQKILSTASDAGMDDLVEFDDAGKRYVATQEFAETSPAVEFIEAFENDSFWEQLNERLVERDLKRQIGEPAWQRLEEHQREEKEDPYRRLYGEEFLAHGVERLEILVNQVLS